MKVLPTIKYRQIRQLKSLAFVGNENCHQNTKILQGHKQEGGLELVNIHKKAITIFRKKY